MAGIICPQCAATNRENARFCAECGAELGVSSQTSPVLPLTSEPVTIKPAPQAEPGASPVETNPLPVETSPTPASEPASDSARVLQNRYRIEEKLGSGGFGAVYRAWDVNLNRPCAVKENLITSPQSQRQFMREATLLANLTHLNLPRVIDHFIAPGEGQYLVMDFVEGEDLATILTQKEIIPCEQAIEWIIQVANALEYLHGQEPPVLHRDIKPSNIRITPKGKAVLVDFGLVKIFDQRIQTTVGARAITPGYAPPEQYGQGKTDERTDIYALGATLYNLLTGHDPLESVARMAGGRLESAHQLNPGVPLTVSDVVERSMALEPKMRFQTAAEFKQALKASQAAAKREQDMKKLVTVMVEPELEIQAAQAPAASASTVGLGSIPQEIGVERQAQPQAAYTVSAPAPAIGALGQPQADRQQPAAEAKPAVGKKPAVKRNWLLLGIGAAALLALCIVSASILAGLLFYDDSESEQATLTYQAGLKAPAQATDTERAAIQSPTLDLKTTRTVEARATLTAQAKGATANAKSNSTATVQARTGATQDALKGFLAEMESQGVLVYGPKSGRILHKNENNTIEQITASVGLRNFITEVTFFNPYSTSEGKWNFGILFRHAGSNIQYRLVFNSDKSWKLTNHIGSSSGKVVIEGKIDDLNTEDGGSNKIRLYAQEERGWLFVNDQFIAELDLSKQYSGGIMLGIGFYKGSEITGKLTEYKDFSVWSMP